MQLREKIISNTVYLSLDYVTVSFLSLIFWFVLGKNLQTSELGIVSTSINFIVLLSVLTNLGVNNALQKLIPELKIKIGPNIIPTLVRMSTKALGASITITIICLIVLSPYLSTFIKIPQNIFLLCVFSIVASNFFSLFGAVLYGLQKMKRYFLTDSLQIITRVLLSLALIYLGLSFFGPIIAFLLAFSLGALFRFDYSYFKKTKASFSYKEMFTYSLSSFVTFVSSSLITNAQYLILSAIKTVEVTGVFTVAFVIVTPLHILTTVLTSAMFPIISELSADKKAKNKQGYLISLLVRYSLFILIPLSLLLITFSKYAVLLFSSPKFLESTSYFPILIPAAMLNGIATIFLSNLYAIGKPKISRNIMMFIALFFICVSIPLTMYFQDASGICLAYLITMVIYFSLSLVYIKKFLKITFFIKDILKILLATTIILMLLVVLRDFVQSVAAIAVLSIPLAILYLLTLLILKFYNREDAKILEFFGKKFPAISKLLTRVSRLINKYQ